MNNSIISFPLPANEPVKAYLAGSPERVALEKELERQSKLVVEIPIIIGGKEIRTGDMGEVTCPGLPSTFPESNSAIWVAVNFIV